MKAAIPFSAKPDTCVTGRHTNPILESVKKSGVKPPRELSVKAKCESVPHCRRTVAEERSSAYIDRRPPTS
jgi:hypothetical protein